MLIKTLMVSPIMKSVLLISTLTGTYYVFPIPKKDGLTSLVISSATGLNNDG